MIRKQKLSSPPIPAPKSRHLQPSKLGHAVSPPPPLWCCCTSLLPSRVRILYPAEMSFSPEADAQQTKKEGLTDSIISRQVNGRLFRRTTRQCTAMAAWLTVSSCLGRQHKPAVCLRHPHSRFRCRAYISTGRMYVRRRDCGTCGTCSPATIPAGYQDAPYKAMLVTPTEAQVVHLGVTGG